MRLLAIAALLSGCRTQPFADSWLPDLSQSPDLATASPDLGSTPDLATRRTLSFETSDYHQSQDCSGIAAGDLDEDGRPDLVLHLEHLTANGSWTRSLGVVLTRADGSLGDRVEYPASLRLSPPVVADFDGDGHLDVLVVGSRADHSETLLLYRGRGDGTLVVPADLATDGEESSDPILGVGDFDGDGRLDAAWCTPGDLHIRSALNLGDGNFAAASEIESGFYTRRIEFGDLDGDQRPELIYLATNGGLQDPALHIAHNLGGSFASPSPQPLPGALSLAVVDWDGDGKLDVLSGGANIDLQRGDGAGHLSAAVTLIHAPYASTLRVADLDGDGRPDVVANETYHVASFRQKSDGTLEVAGRYHSSHGQPPVLVDLDGDGHLDVVTTAVDVMRGYGDATFAGAAYTPEIGVDYYLQAIDIEGDGVLDFVGVSLDGSTVKAVHNDGQAHFTPARPYVFPRGTLVHQMAAADFDGDGLADLVVLVGSRQATTGTLQVLRGQGDGSFVAGATLMGDLDMASLLLAADADGDGRPDLIALSGGNAHVYLDLGAPIVSMGSGPADAVLPLDFDGDGKLDLVAVDSKTGLLAGYLGDGQGGFAPGPMASVGAALGGVGDFDGDGAPDIVVTAMMPLLFNRAGKLVPGAGTPLDAITAGDFDGDGRADLAGGLGKSYTLFVALGGGDGSFAAPVGFYSGGGAEVVADFNGDGLPDFLGCPDYYGCTLLRNTTH